ncbi:hypothetical protein RB195_006030 [Necator americanus]|uniref:Uncharacterized protein n=1 Tax=Necator americanus TaxID=51031 RepID=A0ABR1BQQ9_NECAM
MDAETLRTVFEAQTKVQQQMFTELMKRMERMVRFKLSQSSSTRHGRIRHEFSMNTLPGVRVPSGQWL